MRVFRPSCRVAPLALVLLALVSSAACRSQVARTTTPAAAPSPTLPLAPTALPLTAMPTDLPTLVVIPTITPLTPPITPSGGTDGASGTPAATRARPSAGGGVFVTSIRIEPEIPHNKEQVTFFATFNNTTSSNQNARWCAEVFRPGETRSFGISKCASDTIPRGVSVRSTSGWNIAGIRQCVPVRARIVALEGDVRTPYRMPNGQIFWLDLTACP